MLLNIDKPHGTSILHDETCTQIPKPHGTAFKSIEELGRDGGWFTASSRAEAEVIAEREFPGSTFRLCHYCQATG